VRDVGGKIFGVVLNEFDRRDGSNYYGYSYYGYSSGGGEGGSGNGRSGNGRSSKQPQA